MSQNGLNGLDFSAVLITDFILKSTHQGQCSSQYVHSSTVIVNFVAKFQMGQYIRISVDLLNSKYQRLSKFKFSVIEARV